MPERSGTMPSPEASHRSAEKTRGRNDGNDGNDAFSLLGNQRREKTGAEGDGRRGDVLSAGVMESCENIVPIVPIVPVARNHAGTMPTTATVPSFPHRSGDLSAVPPDPNADDHGAVVVHFVRVADGWLARRPVPNQGDYEGRVADVDGFEGRLILNGAAGQLTLTTRYRHTDLHDFVRRVTDDHNITLVTFDQGRITTFRRPTPADATARRRAS
jgi:hypothetical protein